MPPSRSPSKSPQSKSKSKSPIRKKGKKAYFVWKNDHMKKLGDTIDADFENFKVVLVKASKLKTPKITELTMMMNDYLANLVRIPEPFNRTIRKDIEIVSVMSIRSSAR